LARFSSISAPIPAAQGDPRAAGQAVRVTNWIASGRRIVLLTVFDKTRMRETREIDWALRALRRCIAVEHTVDDDDEK